MVIAAVIAMTVKELSRWIISLIKSILISTTLKATLKVIFTPSNIRVFMDLFFLVLFVYTLIQLGIEDNPATTGDVLMIAMLIIGTIAALVSLLFRLANNLVERERKDRLG